MADNSDSTNDDNVMTDHESARIFKRLEVIGILIMIFGSIQIIFGRSLAAGHSSTHYKCENGDAELPDIGWDAWNGVLAFVTGLFGIHSREDKWKLVTFLVTDICAAVTSAFCMMWLIIYLVDVNDHYSSALYPLLCIILALQMISCLIGARLSCDLICCRPTLDAQDLHQVVVYNPNVAQGENPITIQLPIISESPENLDNENPDGQSTDRENSPEKCSVLNE
ncbi:hypothetical protein BSL78_05716 [Apostichopus japonicus]|uniref:Transmembrane protein n=1 Tax=Stichopus japonicus TaxID=307972 RepID=A0A2G8LAW0_STIJA|nr:hypothetical protein BSL78_05716 [Apostichopus japonicus]